MKFSDLVTEANNNSLDIKRIVVGGTAVLGALSFIFLGLWDVVRNHQPFEPEHFGIGLASVISSVGLAVGAALGLGARSESDPTDPPAAVVVRPTP